MSTIIKSFFCFLILFSCNKYSEKTEQNLRLNAVPVLIKIGYYPSFHQPAETILNLKEKYLIFYNPTSYNPMPPPPPRKDGTSSPEAQKDYEDFLSERPELKPFKSNISQKEVERIFKLADSFKAEDFSDKNIPPALDGMSTNIIQMEI